MDARRRARGPLELRKKGNFRREAEPEPVPLVSGSSAMVVENGREYSVETEKVVVEVNRQMPTEFYFLLIRSGLELPWIVSGAR